MQKSTLKRQVQNYLGILKNSNTQATYKNAFRVIVLKRILKPFMTIEDFGQIDVNVSLDKIKKLDNYSEASKQLYAAAFVSFTKYLNRASRGLTKIAIPDSHGISKTFYKLRDKIKTQAITHEEFEIFYEKLLNINKQHALIAKIIYIGVKRVSEVLNLRIEDIDGSEITFRQSKTRGVDMKTVITYNQDILMSLSKFIDNRKKGFVFLEKKEKIKRYRLNYTFARASKNCHFRVTPHVLRATAITEYKKRGHSAEDISVLSGTTEDTVKKYDKRSLADNISKSDPII